MFDGRFDGRLDGRFEGRFEGRLDCGKFDGIEVKVGGGRFVGSVLAIYCWFSLLSANGFTTDA